jgi:ribosomal protein L7/L12
MAENGIAMIKIIRTIGNIGLADAREIYDYMAKNIPCVLVAGVEDCPVTDLATKIEAAGVQ